MSCLQGSSLPSLHAPIVRRAALDDLGQLLAIEMRSFQSDRLSQRCMRAWLQRPHGHCLLVTFGDRIAGYILVIHRLCNRHARIYSLAVDPDCRGRGLARVLLQAAEQLVNGRGAAHIRLEVSCHNHTAIVCYETRGYTVIGQFSSYYADGSDALRMRKQLPAAISPCAVR